MNIQEIIKDHSASEKSALYDLLRKDLGFILQLEKIKEKLNQDQIVLCSHCKSSNIYGHGGYKGRRRYI